MTFYSIFSKERSQSQMPVATSNDLMPLKQNSWFSSKKTHTV